MLLGKNPETLLKLIHKCYSNWLTNVTRNKPTKVTQIDPQVLLKLIYKCFSKKTHKRYSNWSTSVTQIHLQVLLEVHP